MEAAAASFQLARKHPFFNNALPNDFDDLAQLSHPPVGGFVNGIDSTRIQGHLDDVRVACSCAVCLGWGGCVVSPQGQVGLRRVQGWLSFVFIVR